MQNPSSILLLPASLLALIGNAAAADLPSRNAAPAEFVRVCDTYGAGFFYIPGSQTCLRVGGRVRAETLYKKVFKKDADATGFRARGRLNIDARTATSYGTLRTFLRYGLGRNTGSYNSDGFQAVSDAASLGSAFIQFGPITAGRTSSMFDFSAGESWGTIRGSDATTQLLAYTGTFGSGFSATLSLEDGAQRRTANKTVSSFQGSSRMPDVVANLNLTEGWGSAQVSGAVHEISASSAGAAQKLDRILGFSGQFGVKIKLPMLAAGDAMWFKGGYAEGALKYLDAGSISLGGIKVSAFDAEVDLGTAPRVKLSKGYVLTAGLLHYWTPTIRQAIFASYLSVDAVDQFRTRSQTIYTGQTDYKEVRGGSNLIWSPISGLDIGVEVLYAKLTPKGRADMKGRVPNLNRGGTFTLSSDDDLQARFRIQRDF